MAKTNTKVSKEVQDNTQSYAEEIKRYHQKVITAQNDGYKEALSYAIKCGKALILAKENIKAVKGEWLKWLREEIKLPQTTASLYMRLAENEKLLHSEEMKKLTDNGAVDGSLSIRKAASLLPKRERKASAKAKDADKEDQDDQDDNSDDDTEDDNDNDSSADEPTLSFRLKAVGVDGAINAITEAFDDTEDLRQIIYDLTALLRKTDPQQFALLDMSIKGAQDAAASH